MGIETVVIKEFEKILKLTFLYDKNQDSAVCMANSPEVRDEFKDVFDIKDLLDYCYAVLHSPSYIAAFRAVSKTKYFQVIYPRDTICFWKLANLGSKLRALNLLESSSEEKLTKETAKILDNIAKIKIP